MKDQALARGTSGAFIRHGPVFCSLPKGPQNMGIENPLDESRQRELRSEVATIARGISLRTTPFLDGSRRIASLRFDVAGCEHDEDFMLFAVIDSETDHIPKESAREFCSPNWLEQCDLEIQETWVFYESQVKASCERLCARFENEAKPFIAADPGRSRRPVG